MKKMVKWTLSNVEEDDTVDIEQHKVDVKQMEEDDIVDVEQHGR